MKLLDPVFPMMFLINSWIPGMVDAIGQITFLCGLLLFWLCVYHGLRQVSGFRCWQIPITTTIHFRTKENFGTFIFPNYSLLECYGYHLW